MPVILSFDTETTGLDPEKDHIIEVGAVLYSTTMKRQLEAASWLVKTPNAITEEITDITGVTKPAVDRFGYQSEDALDALLQMAEQAEYWIGQNVIRFDKRFLEAWCKRHGRTLKDKIWIDTMTDLPGYTGKHLSYAAADHNFLNLFPHSALADCQTVLKIVESYDFNQVLDRAKQETVVIRSHQPFEENDSAYKLKFRFNKPLKIWAQVCKEGDVAELQNSAPFKVTIEKQITPDQIWYKG